LLSRSFSSSSGGGGSSNEHEKNNIIYRAGEEETRRLLFSFHTHSKIGNRSSAGGKKTKVISKKIFIFGNVYFLLLDIQMHPFIPSSRVPAVLFSVTPPARTLLRRVARNKFLVLFPFK